MGPKKDSKKESRKLEDSPPFVVDPLFIETSRTAVKWTGRVGMNNRRIVEVQQLLAMLTAKVEVVNQELADVYESANFLFMLRIFDYRQKLNPSPTPVLSKKQKPRRDNATRASIRLPMDENSTEALLASMDEKKRAKVSAALGNLFRRNPTDSPFPFPSQTGVSSPSSQQQPDGLSPPTETLGRQHRSSGFLPDVFSNTMGPEQRRPKDVPPELWDEISKLRLRRILLEDRLALLMGRIDSQLKRFDLLMQSYGISMYASDAMEHILSGLREKRH